MFISTMDLFKIGIGPSSSHTIGPMVAAAAFLHQIEHEYAGQVASATVPCRIQVTLKGSLAYTGHGHATDTAILLGLHGYQAPDLADTDIAALKPELEKTKKLPVSDTLHRDIKFDLQDNLVFDLGPALSQHPNGMIFQLLDSHGHVIAHKTYFSIGGGFISTLEEIDAVEAPIQMHDEQPCPYPFIHASEMLKMADESGLSIADMKRANEVSYSSAENVSACLGDIWRAMRNCIERGLKAQGILPGGLEVERRAGQLLNAIAEEPGYMALNDYLCAYAMAVNEENAAGHGVVTAPTNGAAGVIPSVLHYMVTHQEVSERAIEDFLLTAAAIGGVIKHNSSISGAEVGCQGEVGSAAAMAAAGLCAILGGTPSQIENAAEIALEHHLGMTCDPVKGLVQVPCIERNGFGAIKAFAAASLAKKGTGHHIMPLDACISAMKQTGYEMSEKYKETSTGGLAVSITEC
ncbi:L-serine dehydratase TdcG [BD1-7 clade bacterium]|uniref:L-serine dehydratase n=1 Tax=BD1-7 clade bacterium TaxID=2029982 RepID=A0A5S9QTD2_9GAMM|nr:L-serine dehydratase TdcG [BD1-7 clade bacterium]